MKLIYFEIKNFKGINHIRLDFEAQPKSNIYTLVGLNESGKTTILQAINFLTFKAETLDPLNLPGYSVKDVHDLIPINERSNFNGEIIIEAGYAPEPEDQVKIREFLRKNLQFELKNDLNPFYIRQVYKFESSQIRPQQPITWYNTQFYGRAKGTRKDKPLANSARQKAFTYVKTLLPSILYFPNFLFEFPDKIYLEGEHSDEAKHEFYRLVLQDVLDAIGEHTNLHDHVLARAKDGSSNARRALESVLLKMGSHITATVFKNWNRIFKRNDGQKEIVVGYDRDDEGNWYIQLRLKDANDYYTISERSLGFRWFFAFLLLTQYRAFRKDATKNVLFLFDEPASNLHPSAQSQLLDSFTKFAGESSVIYTTHSHHMINPEWLEGTYVVKNEGIDYDSDEDSYNARKTKITLEKYRSFVAHHPNQTTYFQPILDILDYSPSRLENIPNVVMVEGKNDFYTLKYFQDRALNHLTTLNLMPGSGAGSLETPIRLYTAWGRNFIVLLDSDSTGNRERDRYINQFGTLVRDRVFSLEDIHTDWKKKQMELLVDEQDRTKIQRAAYPEAVKYNKTHFNRAIQELYLTNTTFDLSAITIANFERIVEFCKDKLAQGI